MEAINIFVELVNAFLHVYIGYMLFSYLGKRTASKAVASLSIGGCTLTLAIALLLFKGTFIIYLPMIIVTFLLTLLFDNKMSNKILNSIIYLVVTGIVEIFVGYLMAVAFAVNINEFTNYSAYHISGMLISKFVSFLIIQFIYIKKHSEILRQYKTNYLSVFIFPASTLAVAMLQCKIFVDFPEQNTVIEYWVLVAYMVMILANIIVFDFIDSLYRNTLNESRLQAADEIISNQTLKYNQLIEHNSKVMQLRHDHKNFCVGLKSELLSGNIDAAIRILDKEYDLIKSEGIEFGNGLLAIVESKKQIASSKNIEFNFECGEITGINIPATDLAIILGNALDNAIEACDIIKDETKRYIEISILLKHNNLYISIRNTVIQQIDTDVLSSTKKETLEYHGFGILSMRRIAAKYNGDVLFSCEDNIFSTIIVLKNYSI